MIKNINVLIAGFVISFLGSLPLGTLNITAFNVAASKSTNDAIGFAIAAVVVELIVVRLTLLGDKKIKFNDKLSFYVIPVAVALLIYLAISSFMAVGNAHVMRPTTQLFPAIESAVLLGFLLSALNPLHIPFWMSWNRVLSSRKQLQDNVRSYTAYILGIGLGSIGGLLIFIFAGTRIVGNYAQYQIVINICLGILYLGFSFYLMFLMYKKHLKLKIQ